MLDSLDDDFYPSRPVSEPLPATPLAGSSQIRSYIRIEPAPLLSGKKTHSVYLCNEVSLPYPFVRKVELFRVTQAVALSLSSPGSGIESYDCDGNRIDDFEIADVAFFHEDEACVSIWAGRSLVATLRGNKARELGLFLKASRTSDSQDAVQG